MGVGSVVMENEPGRARQIGNCEGLKEGKGRAQRYETGVAVGFQAGLRLRKA